MSGDGRRGTHAAGNHTAGPDDSNTDDGGNGNGGTDNRATGWLLARALDSVLPAGVLSLLTGGPETGAALA
ncbi:aldehyde dehydrogenase, partial [Micromonospora endophytica]